MKQLILPTIILGAILSACSPINSLKPFDQEEAAKLLRITHKQPVTQQMIRVLVPENWQQIRMPRKNAATQILLPPDESVDNWQERIDTVVNQQPHLTPLEFAHQEIAEAQKNCTQAEAKILASAASYAVYQLNLVGCNDELSQKQMVKVFASHHVLYSVRYSAITGEVSDAEFNDMARAVKMATIYP